MYQDPLQSALFIGTVALSIVAAIWVGTTASRRLAPLTVATGIGVGILAVVGWELLINVPGILSTFFTQYAGLQAGSLANGTLAAVLAMGIGFVVAVIGILRRQAWGIALAVGLCVTRLVMVGIAMAGILPFLGPEGNPDGAWLLVTYAATAAPTIAAIALLLMATSVENEPMHETAPASERP